jgi:hypothetical protein
MTLGDRVFEEEPITNQNSDDFVERMNVNEFLERDTRLCAVLNCV